MQHMRVGGSLSALVVGVVILLALAGCAPAPPPPTTFPTPTMGVDTGWREATRGVEWRELAFTPVGAAESARPVGVFVVRLDPAAVILRVHYTPGEPRFINQWAAQTGAPFLINGSFFTPEHTATGLLVSDGRAVGQSFEGYGGMLQVNGRWPRVRSLAIEPYWPGEPIDQAVQAFPMLLDPGGAPAYPDPNGRSARRSIVGQDREGRLLFITAPYSGVTLYQASRWLAVSDLNLDAALNLDGGGSTALYLNAGAAQRLIVSIDPLPVVIAAYLRY